jgi:hypothetical protein
VYADSSDLTVDSIWLERASAPGVPVAGTDLALDESFNIVAGIKNLGQEAANGYYLDVYYDNDYGRGGPDNITAGEVQEWYVGPLTATAGTHTTQWVVDPDNQIAELDEQNNVKEYVFTVGSGESQTTTGSTATVSLTVTQSATSYSYVTTTTTVTSYTGTSTSTIPTVTTVALVPFTATSTVQNTQYVTSILATTMTSYTGTQALTSTVVVPTTVTLAPLAVTSTAQTGQVQTSTGTTTETKYTTMTITSYTGTSTSASTTVIYTTVTRLASAGVSSPLTYLGFLSLFAVTVGRVMTGKGRRVELRKGPEPTFVGAGQRTLLTQGSVASVPTLIFFVSPHQ